MSRVFEGSIDGRGRRVAIAASRFNRLVTDPLVTGAVAEADIDLAWVPGAFELPLAAERLAASGRYAAVVAVGAVVRGATPHFDHIAGQAAAGLAAVSRATGVPVAFAVLTCDTMEQALDRAGGKAGNKGAEAAVLPVKRGSERDYHGAIDDPRVERVSLLRPQEIPRYVEEGFFDLGITGRDWIEETGAKVASLAELPYSKQTSNPVRVVLAVHRDLGTTRPEDLQPGLRVSTEFPNLTRRFFAELGVAARIFPSYGATEAKVPEIVDAVVDLTETGSTLRNHGMVVIATLLTSFTEVIANPEAADDPERRQAMDDLLTLLVGAATARSKVLIKLNVADADLARVLAVLPSMKAPTVNELADSGFHAVETVVDKAGVNRLIPTLKAAGAFDILELPIAKIVA